MRHAKTLQKRKRALVNRLENNLDFLIGSVVTYRLKCSRNCQCNKGKGHSKVYLSMREAGKTRNLYLPKDMVKQAAGMTRSYVRLKQILKELSLLNYELLRATDSAKSRKS